MPLNLNLWSNHLRVCAKCGRGVFLKRSPIDLYCRSCWENIFDLALVEYCDDYPFKVCTLFIWTSYYPEVENLVYSLKGGVLTSAFERLAEFFAFDRCSQNFEPLDRATLIVPPGRVAKDHAFRWGEALAEQMGFHLIQPFEFATSLSNLSAALREDLKAELRPQKSLKKSERFHRQFKLNKALPPNPGRLIFVDDLITTGATALAAYKALNSPKDFEVWTIARRPKLASNWGI